jgi:hypothetical protein
MQIDLCPFPSAFVGWRNTGILKKVAIEEIDALARGNPSGVSGGGSLREGPAERSECGWY